MIMSQTPTTAPDVAALRFLNLLADAAWRENPAAQRALRAERLHSADIPDWRRRLGSRDPAERDQTARRLLKLRENIVRRLLITLRLDRRGVPQVLREFVDLFTGQIEDTDLRINRNAVIDALVPLGEGAVSGLIALLRSPDAQDQWAILQALTRIGAAAQTAIPDVLLLLDSPTPQIQRAARNALLAIGAPALPPLITLTGHSHARMRAAAAEVVGPIAATHPDSMQRRRAIEALLHGLYDQHSAMRSASAHSLGQIGTAHPEQVIRIASALLPLLADRDNAVRAAVQHSFTAMGTPVVPILAGALASRSHDIRRTAHEVLASMDSDEARSALDS
jgi:HEAT repeat protein